MSTEEKKGPPLGLQVLRSYTLTPACWTKFILGSPGSEDRGIPPTDAIDVGIPASFWKYTHVLWADVVGMKGTANNFTARKTMADFGIRPATAMRWTAAYRASGLFEITLGARHLKDQPTKGPSLFRYLNGSEYEWDVFIRCLSWLCRNDKVSSQSQEGSAGSVAGFRAALTWVIFCQKRKEEFRPAISTENMAFLKECEANGLTKGVPGSDPMHRIQFCRTPTNRLGVLDKNSQLDYYQLQLDEGINSVAKQVRFNSDARASREDVLKQFQNQ